jgi:hypothetical protein
LFVNHENVAPEVFTRELAGFRLGLDLPVYKDGLPNFRFFEAGAAGVLPFVHERYADALDALVGLDDVLYYNNAWTAAEVERAVRRQYDPSALQARYNEHHSLRARLTQLFDEYFDLTFR